MRVLQFVAFFAVPIVPYFVFLLYVHRKKAWTFRKTIPYGLAYFGAFAAFLAWIMNMHGWDFVIVVGLCLGVAALALNSWAALLDDLIASKRAEAKSREVKRWHE